MKLLILGGGGMAGHMLVQYFQQQGRHTCYYTTRNEDDSHGLFLDVADAVAMEKVIDAVRPDVIINAIGILNQFAAMNIHQAYYINGLFPHYVEKLADRIRARLIHISSDCVFEGTRGSYTEVDEPDGISVYAKTKALGEVKQRGHLTIRTSIIGPELKNNGIGLMNWFMNATGEVSGYRNVLWNGVTTLELAKVIDQLLSSSLSGLIHLCHPIPISKHDLLVLFQKIWQRNNVTITPSDTPILDRTLVSTRTDWSHDTPSYFEMLKELEAWMRKTSLATKRY